VVTYPLTEVDLPTQWTSGSLREPGRQVTSRLSRLKALVMLSGVIRAKSELLIVVIVDTGDGAAGLFYASIPENAPQFVQPARDALAALKVDG